MSNKSEVTRQDQYQLIEIRRLKKSFASFSMYQAFRTEMLSLALQPWFRGAYQHQANIENIPESVCVILGYKKSGGLSHLILLAYEELEHSINIEDRQLTDDIGALNTCIQKFKPICWDDWLMVPNLYLMQLRSKKHLPTLNAKSDPWIDAVLKETRGVLMWTYQFVEIVRMIANISITEATQLSRGWILRDSKVNEIIGNVIYEPTKQNLLEIIKERTLGMAHLGAPDYIFADWLSRHYQYEI